MRTMSALETPRSSANSPNIWTSRGETRTLMRSVLSSGAMSSVVHPLVDTRTNYFRNSPRCRLDNTGTMTNSATTPEPRTLLRPMLSGERITVPLVGSVRLEVWDVGGFAAASYRWPGGEVRIVLPDA